MCRSAPGSLSLSKHVTEALLHCGEATWQTAIGWFVGFFGLGNYYLSWFFFFYIYFFSAHNLVLNSS